MAALFDALRCSRSASLAAGWLVRVFVPAVFAMGLVPSRMDAQSNSDEDTDRPVAILAARANDRELLQRSRIWYILSQDNAPDLFFGMPQRLGKASAPSRRKEPLWQGVDDGGSVELVVEFDQELGDEVLVGFFRDPRWWTAEPAQVRSFAKPGRHQVYSVDRLPPGKYWVGAMLGSLPRPKALGIHGTWPGPIKVQAGKTTTAELRVSSKFTDVPAGQSNVHAGFAGHWPKLDPAKTLTVRTVDENWDAIPFCSIVLCERNPNDRRRLTWFRQFGTDDQGVGYCDQLTGPFSVNSQRFDFVPEQLIFRYHAHHEAMVRELADSKEISVTCGSIPTGKGRISGRVHDSAGRPVTKYFLWIQLTVGDIRGTGEYDEVFMDAPVMDGDGRFSVGGLAAGSYVVQAIDFDGLRYVWPIAAPPHVELADEDGAEATVDLELEARELRYGKAVDEDGNAIVDGGWVTRTEPESSAWSGRSVNFESDSSFRVLLSKKEREQLDKRADGLVEFYTFPFGKGQAKAWVRFDELSLDPARPTVVVLRKENEKSLKSKPVVPVIGRSPEFKLLDTAGRAHRLSDYRGKVVLLNFFGTTCVPCMNEWPHLAELSHKQSKAGLVVLAICSSSAEVLKEFVAERKPPFVVLIDDEFDAATQIRDDPLNVPLPTNVLVDRRGRIAYLNQDFTDELFAELSSKVEELLNEPVPTDRAIPKK